ncbi:MAG: hypothetical protein ACE5IY_08975 [bacterium]
MNIRILTGTLVPKLNQGVATITFNPFSVTGDAEVTDPKTLGNSADYTTFPARILSLKKITVADKNNFFGGSETDMFSIDDHFANKNTLVIKWSSTGGSLIREISFMITGETAL